MRIIASSESLRRALRWIQGSLFTAAVSALAYCGFVLFDSWTFQRRAQRELADQTRNLNTAESGQSGPGHLASPQAPEPVKPGSLIGSIAIPRLGLLASIAEGTDTKTLRRAVGHIPSTALPGHPDNVGLAGHRDTFFRPLKDVRRNDVITLTTLSGAYQYRVVSTRVVLPTEVSVLDSSPKEILTLVTCHPFYFIGAAPQRFIVKAERVYGLP